MNTVFKFYLQAWVLFGTASAVCIVWLFRFSSHTLASPSYITTDGPNVAEAAEVNPDAPDTRAGAEDRVRLAEQHLTRRKRAALLWQVWKGVLVLLVSIAALYPVLATRAKINDRWSREPGPGLDGLAWMRSVTDVQFGDGAPEGLRFSLQGDYAALMWLRENVQGSPVVAEGAKAPPYRSLRGRVATYTGLPIIIGYPWHQTQQRSFVKADVIGQREQDVNNLYSTSDPWLAQEILDRYDVSLVYVGDLERAHYAPTGIAKFAQMAEMGLLRSIYANEGVTIYQVVR